MYHQPGLGYQDIENHECIDIDAKKVMLKPLSD